MEKLKERNKKELQEKRIRKKKTEKMEKERNVIERKKGQGTRKMFLIRKEFEKKKKEKIL